MKNGLRAAAALIGGFGLSFVGLGVLWVGTPWPYQALMLIPFLLLSFAIAATGPDGDRAYVLVLAGAAPIGLLLTQFRDRNDSHLNSILIVCAWLAGALLGPPLAAMWRRRNEIAR